MRRIAAVGVGIALVVLARTAWAGEDEVIVSAEAGYAALDGPDDDEGRARHGFGVGASAWIGTDSPLWVAPAVSGNGVFGAPEDRGVVEALVGLVYTFDVFAAVPFAEAQAGLIVSTGRDRTLLPSARFGLGVDYLFTRTMSLGLVARIRPLGSPLGDALMTGQIRWAVRLEY